LFVLVASSASSWFGIHYRRAQQENAVLAELDKFQPLVTSFPWEYRVSFLASPLKPGDDDLAPLARLPRLNSLVLFRTPVTDAGLAHLAKIGGLESLDLHGTKITDAGLVHLEHLTRLKHLDLSGTQVTDAGTPAARGAAECRDSPVARGDHRRIQYNRGTRRTPQDKDCSIRQRR
jgi:hypothetical protein